MPIYNVLFNLKVNNCSSLVVKLGNRQRIQKNVHVINNVNVLRDQTYKKQVIMSGCFL